MAKLAIDVALLPPGKVMDTAVLLNQKYSPKFELSKDDRRPHITISQAVIEDSSLEKASSRLEKLARNFRPLKLNAKIANYPDSLFRISPTKEILALHQAVMEGLNDLVSYDAKAEYYLDGEVRQATIDWVNNFRSGAAFDNFDPHISLGVGEMIQGGHPLSFTADWLTVCHLGNYNTCRKILWQTRLK